MNSESLPPAIWLTHTHSGGMFLFSAGFLVFILFVILSLSVYSSVKNRSEWSAGRGIAIEFCFTIFKLLKVLWGAIIVFVVLLAGSITWSVTIGQQGIRILAPWYVIHRGGVLAWPQVEKAKIIRLGKRGNAPYISVEGNNQKLIFPLWEMSNADVKLTCEMIFSKLKDQQLAPSRAAVMHICENAGAGSNSWLSPSIQLKQLRLNDTED